MSREYRNPSELTKREFDQNNEWIENLMENFGEEEPESYVWDENPAIIIDENNEIIDGHHRHEAFVRLGYTKCPVIVIDREWYEQRQLERGMQVALCEWCEGEEDYVTSSIYNN